MTLENKKTNFGKIFKFNSNYSNLYTRVISATTDSELNQIISDYITNIINEPLSFEEKKTININFNKVKNACSSQDNRVINCSSEEELSEITAQNYTWWRNIKNH